MKGVLSILQNKFAKQVSSNPGLKILLTVGFFNSFSNLMKFIITLPVIIAENFIVVNTNCHNFIIAIISLTFIYLFSKFEQFIEIDGNKKDWIIMGGFIDIFLNVSNIFTIV